MKISKIKTIKQLEEIMESCEQTKGQSVLQHGKMVFKYFQDLYYHLVKGSDLKHEWKLPDWIYDKYLINNLVIILTKNNKCCPNTN